MSNTYTPTMSLRFVEREYPVPLLDQLASPVWAMPGHSPPPVTKKLRILQQMVEYPNGIRQWVDVPLESENG